MVLRSAFWLLLLVPHGSVAGQPDWQIFLDRYCLECHDESVQKGDRRFDLLEADFAGMEALTSWQEILDQLNLGQMPPTSAGQPAMEDTLAMVHWISGQLKDAREEQALPLARPVLRRLNREQYDHTVRALLELRPMLVDPTVGFPQDEEVENFDTVGAALGMSDFRLQAYLKAAQMLVEKATCESVEPPLTRSWEFQAPFSDREMRPDGLDVPGKYQHLRKNPTQEGGFIWLSELPDGVPQDGWYELRFTASGLMREYPYEEALIGVDKQQPLRLAVVAGNAAYGDLSSASGVDRDLVVVDLPDDQPQEFTFRIWLDQGFQPRFTFRNGPNQTKSLRKPLLQAHPEHFQEYLSMVDPEDGDLEGLDPKWIPKGRAVKPVSKHSAEAWIAWTRGYQGPRVRLHEVALRGPLFEQWPTSSHEQLYGDARPVLSNAPKILKRFAEKAFRRPAAEEELEALLAVTRQMAEQGASDLEAIQAGLITVLCSPGFLYLENSETASPELVLASRLSYFLWSEPPDDRLRHLAAAEELSRPEVYRSEVLRLLGDARSEAFVSGFVDRWLELDRLGMQPPAHESYPEYYSQDLQRAMLGETRAYFRHVLQENLPVSAFLSSDFTFLNAALARHYGMDGVDGHHFRLVRLGDTRRGGLLGQAAVLTASANGSHTSPIMRGTYILENLLGTPPSHPPPDIEPLEPDVRGALTIREQLRMHSEAKTCAECHRKIDPYGFALENFDPIGGWRASYTDLQGEPAVDAAGQLPDGTVVTGVSDLKEALMKRRAQFARALTEKLLVYSTGRTMTTTDRPYIDAIVEALESEGWGFQDLVILVTRSEIFRR